MTLLFRDIYHRILKARWRNLFALALVIYLGVNLLFAKLYLLEPGGVAGLQPDNYLDSLFFSFQTISTVGYGRFHPVGPVSNALAAFEAFLGLLGFAIFSGLMLAKFSRPTAKIVFARKALITQHNGEPVFLFRTANERENQILEASFRLYLLCDEDTKEGKQFRKLKDLKLERERTPAFALTFTAIHKIVPGSPLYGETAESLRQKRTLFSVSFIGLDDIFSQTVNARHEYHLEDIQWGGDYVDILSLDAHDKPKVDLKKIHDTIQSLSKEAP